MTTRERAEALYELFIEECQSKAYALTNNRNAYHEWYRERLIELLSNALERKES